MSKLRDIAEQVLLGQRVRQNHALEHATIALLSARHPKVVFTGRSTANGFYVWGKVDAGGVRTAADEALERLRTTEPDMALHPRCGTNLAVASVMAFGSSVCTTPSRCLMPDAASAAASANRGSRPVRSARFESGGRSCGSPGPTIVTLRPCWASRAAQA